MALTATSAGTASVGYAGTSSDGLTQLDSSHTMGSAYSAADDGHIVATEAVTHGSDFTLALGFGRTQSQAVDTARASLRIPFVATFGMYEASWHAYDGRLRPPTAQYARTYYLDANVLKSSEDKTYPGAIVASLASPWGQAVNAGVYVGGQPVYFGSYREVFARDLYEAFTGLLADGDISTARDARFLSTSNSCPPARSRATRSSTVRPLPTRAATSWTRPRTRS